MSLIAAANLTVEYPIYQARSRSLKNIVISAATGGKLALDPSDRTVVRAIDGLNFEWREGDRIGLVGHNGSGKTTLLRAIAGVYEPIGGEIEVVGQIASMLSISVGMDLDATGYENIFLRGTLLGLDDREIAELADEVCAFSDLGEFIHMPMRTYSSGMVMRLMFAISTAVQADIILMDEWLSVGDADFSVKAQERLSKMVDKAKILVIASHSPEIIQGNCNKVVHLEHGRIVSVNTV